MTTTLTNADMAAKMLDCYAWFYMSIASDGTISCQEARSGISDPTASTSGNRFKKFDNTYGNPFSGNQVFNFPVMDKATVSGKLGSIFDIQIPRLVNPGLGSESAYPVLFTFQSNPLGDWTNADATAAGGKSWVCATSGMLWFVYENLKQTAQSAFHLHYGTPSAPPSNAVGGRLRRTILPSSTGTLHNSPP